MAAALLIALLVFVVLASSGAFVREVWTRKHPLVDPITVADVNDGTITLVDGRSFKPAGVRRSEAVTPEDYDNALCAMIAQGALVDRDLGDGRALLIVEPKFVNWCGTIRGWTHWAGCYVRLPLGVALIQSGYATADVAQAGLTPRDVWRLQGVTELGVILQGPASLRGITAFSYEGYVEQLDDYDARLAEYWRPARQ